MVGPLKQRRCPAVFRVLSAVIPTLAFGLATFAPPAAPGALQPDLVLPPPDAGIEVTAGALQIALRHLLLHAPIVFAGQVLPSTPSGSLAGPDNSSIRIRVEHGLRGVRDGEVFVYRDWQSSNTMILTPGQRVILFLHQPNAAGLTSSAIASFRPLPVTGADQVDVRQLLLMERQLDVPAPTNDRDPGVSPEAIYACSARPFKPAWSAVTAEGMNHQLLCRRSSLPPPPGPFAESMPESLFLALVRQALTSGSAPDGLFHAP